MIHSNTQHRSCLFVGRLLTGLLLATCLAPAARGEGWPYWPFNREDKPGKPDKIVTLWSDTVLTQPGRPPIRGFGGRLMFYEGKKEEPIKVEGTLVVYAFDETDRDANNARPDRKYAFTPQQLPPHYSKSKIGHSYSVWLPWDEVGGPQKEITLIVRFEPKEGAVAISDPCRQLLPGRIVAARAQVPAGGVFSLPGQAGAAPPAGGAFAPVGQAGPIPVAANNWGNGMLGSPVMSGGVQPVAYQTPVTDGGGAVQAPWQPRHFATATIDVPSGSAIRSAITGPQVSAAAGEYRPGSGLGGSMPAPGQNYGSQNYPSLNYQGQNYGAQYYPLQNYPSRNYSPQNYPSPGRAPTPGYSPPAAPSPAPPSSAQPGLQLRSGFAPGRQWPLGEPLARLSHDRAPSQPHPAEPPFGPASPPAQAAANAAPAAPSGAPQWPN